MRLARGVLFVVVGWLVCCQPALARRPFSRYLEFGRIMMVVTNEPEGSPALELLFSKVRAKERVVTSPEEAKGHLEELGSKDATVIFLINHHRGSGVPEIAKEVLAPTTFEPLPTLSRDTLVTICRRRKPNTDLLELFIAAPDSGRLERELKRFLDLRSPVPYLRQGNVFYCVVATSQAKYAERLISSRAAIEAQVFTFDEMEKFLAAAGGNSEVYIVDRQDGMVVPEEMLKRMPLNPFTLAPGEAVSAVAEKEGEESVALYTAPCERFLLELLGKTAPMRILLPDLSGASAVGVSDLAGSAAGEGERTVLDQASSVLSEEIFRLCQRKGLAVVERTRFKEVAEELGLQAGTGLFDEATAAHIGKLAGAQAILLSDAAALDRRTDHLFREWRSRDGTREKWAWHWKETMRERAEVTVNLRLVDVETATQIWNATVSASEVGEDTGVREEKRDEVSGRKSPRPSWYGEDYSLRRSSDTPVLEALKRAISGGVERLEEEVVWPTDLAQSAGVEAKGEVSGWISHLEGESVFVSIDKGMEFLGPGTVLYVVAETKVGKDVYRRRKAVLVVKEVRTESAECIVRSVETGEALIEYDVVTSRAE